ncbi:nucleoside deaminase [Leptospira idonii]|uniref:Nucleoside deaminase n=1 Tax=Leptospira idonii TaxID=1193500 RepID=A0A4R9M2F8_9LEPT|nr:nucleoside deaminase [Leptospira idonii]TGN20302.1 nucleoside deaminase [Leptospira idonii]
MDILEKFQTRWFDRINSHPDEIPSFTQIYDTNSELLSESFNLVEHSLNATLHSEILAIEKALTLRSEKYLMETILITALEPCLQCAGAILRVKIPEIVYFVPAKPGEGISSYSTESIYLLNHFPKLTLIEKDVIKNKFREFFREKR